MEVAAVSAARWVVGKALGPVSDGLVEAWAASNKLGPNVDSLKMELLYARAMLNNTRGREIHNPDLNVLLQKLRDLAYDADDVLDELDYFRIQDEIYHTYHAADEHAKGCLHDLALHARHTAKAAACKLLGFSACSCTAGDPSDSVEEEATCGAIRKLASGARNTFDAVGKRLCCSKFPLVHANGSDDDSGISFCCGACMHKPPQQRKHVIKETPKLKIDRVGLSIRMKNIVEQLQPVCAKVTTILNLELLGYTRSTESGFARSRPITTPTSIEPKLYGRDDTKTNIINSINQATYYGKDLTVLPIVGPGGIGKTALVQEVYNSQEMRNHFQIKVWICVSQNFNVDKLTEEIKKYVPSVEGENENARAEELIELRLKSKRLLLVLDDIWKCDSDDWKRLLVPLTKGQTKGSIIMVTTRFPVVAKMVSNNNNNDIFPLKGLVDTEFWRFFHVCVFDHEEPSNDHTKLLKIGKDIVKKLKGSPLAAKTVGRLLSKHLDQKHWMRILESKEWESQAGEHDIMPALKLSYNYLPYHLQQCFSYCALFPEDHNFDSEELINFWIGLDILHSECHNKTFEDVALSNLEDLVNHGFFKKDETDGRPCYIIHDLLHNLAVKVASQECVSLHCRNVRSVGIRPSVRHLSIIIDGEDDSDGITNNESFMSELLKLKTRVRVENLQTLIIFGKLDGSFVEKFHDLFKEARAFRLLHLPNMFFPVEFVLSKFSTLLHLRYLRLGKTYGNQLHLTSALSRFYHLKILDLKKWSGSLDLPRDFSNLSKLRHFLTPVDHHPAICNVGKLQFLQELENFEVNEEEEGFELKQLGHLMELRRLGIYKLDSIHTKEAATEAKLLNKNHLQKLALSWDKCQASRYPDKEDQVLENLRPCYDLKELSIIEHGGSTCPSWLGAELSVKSLETLHLSNVTWKILPPLGELCLVNELREEFVGCNTGQNFQNLKRLELVGLPNLRKWAAKEFRPMFFSLMEVLIVKDCKELIELPFSYYTFCPLEGDGKATWFPKLKEAVIQECPKLMSLPPTPYTQILCDVYIEDVGTVLKKLVYSSKFGSLSIKGNMYLNCLDDKILAFHNLSQLQDLEINDCQLLAVSYLQMLTSLKKLKLIGSNVVFNSLESKGDDECQIPVEYLYIKEWHVGGKALSLLFAHLPKLSQLGISECPKITRLRVAVEQQQTIAVDPEDTQANEPNQQQQRVAEEDLVEEEEDSMLLLPAHLSNSLRELVLSNLPELILDVGRPRLPTSSHKEETIRGGGLQPLRSLQKLDIYHCPKFLFAYQALGCPFPSSLQHLWIIGCMEGVQTLDFLSSLSSLTQLDILGCGDLRCEGLWPLLTQGQLSKLRVECSPRFFSGLDPILTGLQQDEQEQQLLPLQYCSSKLQELDTVDFAGVLVKPFCRLLSPSLTDLYLQSNYEVERFTKEQEEALQLLTSLQVLEFCLCDKLQCLPAGLHKLTSLKILSINYCPNIRSLPKGGLPTSLQELDVSDCGNEKLKQHCRKLIGTIPEVILE